MPEVGERRLRRLKLPSISAHELPLLILLVGMLVYFSVESPVFLEERNLQVIGRAFFAELCLLAIASALVLLTRGIDLSVASMLALSAITVGALSIDVGMNIWLACLLALVVGVLAGSLNGVLIVFVPLSPIIATLTTLTLYRGIAFGISNGQSYSGYPSGFSELGKGTVAGIPTQVVIVAAILAIVMFVMHRTIVGRWIYATGGNREAARLAGVPVRAVTIGVYAASGLLSALAGIIAVARFNTARADFATGLELDAITAAILGGVSIAGGRGYVFSAALGALTLAFLRNGLTLVGESGFIQVIAIGVILLLSVLADRAIERFRIRRETRKQLALGADREGSGGIQGEAA